MRRAVAQGMELSAFAAIIAGVYLVVGLGFALVVGGVLLAAGSLVLEMTS